MAFWSLCSLSSGLSETFTFINSVRVEWNRTVFLVYADWMTSEIK